VKIHLLDATGLLFRAYYGAWPSKAPDGTPNHAISGLLDRIVSHISRHKPHHVAAVFDAGQSTFRNDLYAQYKANRGDPPPDLKPQFEPAITACRAMGLPTYVQRGFEADDLLASLTRRLAERSERVEITVVSADKDLMQLVGARVRWMNYTSDVAKSAVDVHKRFGVRPDQVADWLALVGDAVDNIPGVRGVGPKSATAILSALGSIDAITSEPSAICDIETDGRPLRGRASIAESVQRHVDTGELALFRELTNLVDDLDVDIRPLIAGTRGLGGQQFRAFCASWGLRYVARRAENIQLGPRQPDLFMGR